MVVRFSQRAAIALTLFTVAAALPCRAKDDVVTPNRKIEAFDLPQVRLLPSPFKNAQDKNAAYLLSVDADRLLARIRANAGRNREPRVTAAGKASRSQAIPWDITSRLFLKRTLRPATFGLKNARNILSPNSPHVRKRAATVCWLATNAAALSFKKSRRAISDRKDSI